jgi:hypothetical protein
MFKVAIGFVLGVCVTHIWVTDTFMKKREHEMGLIREKITKGRDARIKRKEDAMKNMSEWIRYAQGESDPDFKEYHIEQAIKEMLEYCR